MKNKIHGKLIYIISIGLLVSACNNGHSGYSAATDTTGIKIDTTGKHVQPDAQNMPDANRLVHVTAMHLNIIEAAKLGLNKPISADLRNRLNKVIEDNQQAIIKLKKAAGNQNVGLPDSAQASGTLKNEKLQNENGKTFERDFLNRIIVMSRQAIDSCQKYKLAAINAVIIHACDTSSHILQSDYEQLSAIRNAFDNENRKK